jgi:hypothetical protein
MSTTKDTKSAKAEEELAAGITMGDKYGPAMEIEDQAEADAYFNKLVNHALRTGGVSCYDEAVRMERANLGYFAGYFDYQTRERVERLFKCAHPFFGSIAEKGEPSPDEAFRLGKLAGQEALIEQLSAERDAACDLIQKLFARRAGTDWALQQMENFLKTIGKAPRA